MEFLTKIKNNFISEKNGTGWGAILGTALLAIVGYIFGGGIGGLLGLVGGGLMSGPMNDFLATMTSGSGPTNMANIKGEVREQSTGVELAKGQAFDLKTAIPVTTNKGPEVSASSVDTYLGQTRTGLSLLKQGKQKEAQEAFDTAAVARDGLRTQVNVARDYNDKAHEIIGNNRKVAVQRLMDNMVENSEFTMTSDKQDAIRAIAEKAVPKPFTLSENATKLLTESGSRITIPGSKQTLSLDDETSTALASANTKLLGGQKFDMDTMNNFEKAVVVHNHYAQEIKSVRSSIDWTGVERAFDEGSKAWLSFRPTEVQNAREDLNKLKNGTLAQQQEMINKYGGYIENNADFERLKELTGKQAVFNAVDNHIQTKLKPAVSEALVFPAYAADRNAVDMSEFKANMAEFHTTGNLRTRVEKRSADRSPNDQDSTFFENYHGKSGNAMTIVVNNVTKKATHYYYKGMNDLPYMHSAYTAIPNGGIDAKDLLEGTAEGKAKAYSRIVGTIKAQPWNNGEARSEPSTSLKYAAALANVAPIKGVELTGNSDGGTPMLILSGVTGAAAAKPQRNTTTPPAAEGEAPRGTGGNGVARPYTP